MNRKQRACLIVGFLLLLLATVFPPWRTSYGSSSFGLPRLPRLSGSPSYSSSYGFLFKPPSRSATIEISRLVVEWALIALLTGGLFFWFRKPRSTDSESKTGGTVMPSQLGCCFFVLEHSTIDPTVVYVDDQGNVDAWIKKQSHRVGTREVLEANGAKFMTAKGEDIIKAVMPSDATPITRTKRPLIVFGIVLFAICFAGFGYYLITKKIVRELRPVEVTKVTGEALITDYGSIELNAYNGTDFVLTEVTVSISVFNANRNAVISNRAYRLFPTYAYGLNPQSSAKFSAELGFTLEQGQTWQFTILGAKGRPE